LAVSTRRIGLGALFGVMILAINGFIPAPASDFLIVFQSLFLALSYLVLGKGGASYVGVVSGVLITAVKLSFFPLDLVFSIMFGVAVDVLAAGFRAKEDGQAKALRLVACMMLSTGFVGFAAYYVTAVMTNLVPNNFSLDLTVLIFGIVSGAIGGAVAARLWNRNLKARFHNRY
jgi:tetrahydromethanopterin S-methyltransferase subunit E